MATRHTRHYHPELPEPDVFRIRRTWNTACDGHTNIGEITLPKIQVFESLFTQKHAVVTTTVTS